MSGPLHLWPRPERAIPREGGWRPPAAPRVAGLAGAETRRSVAAILAAVPVFQGLEPVPPGSPTADLSLEIRADAALPPQGYTLEIGPRGVTAVAGDAAGLRHAALTLRQALRAHAEFVPAARIEDAPAFGTRGFLLDISRDKVPTMATLLQVFDLLEELKYNRVELYTEHTFAYRDHREVWAEASPLTAEEIRALDAAASARGLDLVPNQNSFGHFERWLKHPRYAPLAECPDGCRAPWGPEIRPPSTLNPLDPRSLALVDELYAELLPNFTSRNFNIGCDETYEIGQGHSRDAAAARGKGRVYLDFLLALHERVVRHGRRMNFWGDIIIEHPELIPELPRDCVALEWGYDAGHPFAAHAETFRASGLEFFVCPGTSTWNSIAGRTTNARANLREAAAAGRAHGASGYLVTDWGDNGHWQPASASWLPLALAAGEAWGGGAPETDADWAAVDRHVFRDATGHAARAFAALGDVHLPLGKTLCNATILFRLLADRFAPDLLDGVTPRGFAAAGEAIEEAVRGLSGAALARPDAETVREEFAQAARMLRLAVARGQARLAKRDLPAGRELEVILAEHRRLWLVRNRPGGLADSAARLEALRAT